MLEINSKLSISLKEFEFKFSRSPGPGGQNVNKLNTKVMLRWNVASSRTLPEKIRERLVVKYHRRVTKEGILIVTSSRFRDQGRNVGDALHKLKQLIVSVATDPKPRKKNKPSAGSNRRRLENKKIRSEKKIGRKTPKFD